MMTTFSFSLLTVSSLSSSAVVLKKCVSEFTIGVADAPSLLTVIVASLMFLPHFSANCHC